MRADQGNGFSSSNRSTPRSQDTTSDNNAAGNHGSAGKFGKEKDSQPAANAPWPEGAPITKKEWAAAARRQEHEIEEQQQQEDELDTSDKGARWVPPERGSSCCGALNLVEYDETAFAPILPTLLAAIHAGA